MSSEGKKAKSKAMVRKNNSKTKVTSTVTDDLTSQHQIVDYDFNAITLAEKKKKKKKKTTFDIDAAFNLDDKSTKKEEEAIIQDSSTTNKQENLDFVDFGLKKKKKKKKPFDLELVNDLPSTSKDAEAKNKSISQEQEVVELDGLDIDFTQMKKKKKFKKKDLEELVSSEQPQQDNAQNILAANEDGNWIDNDQDYTYDDLLQRAFNIMHEKNPHMAEGRRARFTMRPPQVIRIGSRKTSFVNFMDFAKAFHRVPKHLQDFVLSELGTCGSLDGSQQLIIKGRFQPKQLESILRRYVKEYVTCKTCHSFETILKKETRLFFLQCETCGSRCTVATIRSGFQAVTGKRAAIRARKD